MKTTTNFNQQNKNQINNNLNKNTNKSKIHSKNEKRNFEKRRSIRRITSDNPDELLYEHEEIPLSLKPHELQKSFNNSSKSNEKIIRPISKKNSCDNININVNIIINKNNTKKSKNEEEKKINNNIKLIDNKKNNERVNNFKQKISNSNSKKENILSTSSSKKTYKNTYKKKNLSFFQKTISSQTSINSNLNNQTNNNDKKSMKSSPPRFNFKTLNFNGKNTENTGMKNTPSFTKYLKTSFSNSHRRDNSNKKFPTQKKDKNSPPKLPNKEKDDIYYMLFNKKEKFYFTDYQKNNLRNIIMELNQDKNKKYIKHKFISNKNDQETNMPKINTNTNSNSFFFTSIDNKITNNDSQRNNIQTHIENSYKKSHNLKTSPATSNSINYYNHKPFKKNKTIYNSCIYPKKIFNNKSHKSYPKSTSKNKDSLTYNNNYNHHIKNRQNLSKKIKANYTNKKSYYTSPIINNQKYNDHNITINKMKEYLNENKYYQKPKNKFYFLFPLKVKSVSKFNEVKNHVLYSMKDQRNPYSTTFTGKILMDNYNVAFHYKNFEQSVPSLYIRNYGRNYDCSSNKKISNNNSNEKKSFNKMSFRDNFNYKKAKDIRMRQLQYSEKLDRSKGKSKKK